MMKANIASLSLVAVLGVVGCEKKDKASPRPDTVSLLLDPGVVSADDGRVVARALVSDHRDPLSGFVVRFEVALVAATGADPVVAPVTAETDVNGVAEIELSGLIRASAGALTATAMRKDGTTPYLDSEDAPIADMEPLRVSPGAPDTLDLSLPVSAAAGTTVAAGVVVRDANSNRVSDAPVEISTNAPGAVVIGNEVTITAAGVWLVGAAVIGSAVSDDEMLVVTPEVNPQTPGGAAAVRLTPSASLLEAGSTLSASFLSVDSYGNAVNPQPNGTVTVAPVTVTSPAVPITGASPAVFAFLRTGTFAVKVDLGSGITDTESVQVVDTTSPAFDDAATTLSGFQQGPVTDGLIDADDTLQLSVRGITDAVGVIEVQFLARIPGVLAIDDGRFFSPASAGPVDTTFSFTIPPGVPAGATVTIGARILDGSGNVTVVDRSGIIDPLSTLTIEPGFTARVVAIGFLNPQDSVANRSAPGGGMPTRLYVADRATGLVEMVDLTNPTFQGRANVSTVAMGLNAPVGLSLDEGAAVGDADDLLYVTTRDDGSGTAPIVRRIDLSDAFPVSTFMDLVNADTPGILPGAALQDLRFDPTDSAGIAGGGPVLLAVTDDPTNDANDGLYAFDLGDVPPISPFAPTWDPFGGAGMTDPWGIETVAPADFSDFLVSKGANGGGACGVGIADDDVVLLDAGAPSFAERACSTAIVNARGISGRGSSGPGGATQVIASMGIPSMVAADGFVIRESAVAADVIIAAGFLDPIGLAMTADVVSGTDRDLFVVDSATGIIYGIRGPF